MVASCHRVVVGVGVVVVEVAVEVLIDGGGVRHRQKNATRGDPEASIERTALIDRKNTSGVVE